MDWTTRIAESTLRTAEKVAQGFHAIPVPISKDTLLKDVNPGIAFLKNFPSLHRLLNVVGMVSGFAATQYMSNIFFGCKINGGVSEDIPKESVPAPLRFMHGIIKYNAFSDDPRDQWLKVVHQILPAMGGAYGAVKGSEVFFTTINGREKTYNSWKKQTNLSPVQAEAAVSFAQGKQWRKVAGLTALFSSASGLTALYGLSLNSAFMLCNGGKVGTSKFLRRITGNPSEFGVGPEKGTGEILKGVEAALKDGSTETLSKNLVEVGIEPLKKLGEKDKKAIVREIRGVFDNALGGMSAVPTKQDIDGLRGQLKKKVDGILLNTKMSDLNIDNTNGILGAIANLFPGMADEIGHFRKVAEQSASKLRG